MLRLSRRVINGQSSLTWRCIGCTARKLSKYKGGDSEPILSTAQSPSHGDAKSSVKEVVHRKLPDVGPIFSSTPSAVQHVTDDESDVIRFRTAASGWVDNPRPFSATTSSSTADEPDVPFDWSKGRIRLSQDKDLNVQALANSFRIATYPTNSPLVTIGLCIDAGASSDRPEYSGAAFLLSKLFFGGSKDFPRDELRKLSHEGAITFKTFHDREFSYFYCTTLKENAGLAIRIINDAIRNLSIDEEAFEEAKRSAVAEVAGIDGRQQVLDYLHMAAFQGTPLANPMFGSVESLQMLSPESVNMFMEDNFKAPRMCLLTMGGMNESELFAEAEKVFSDVTCNYEYGIGYDGPVRFTASRMTFEDDNVPYCHSAFVLDNRHGYHNSDHWIMFDVIRHYSGVYNKLLLGIENTGSPLAAEYSTYFKGDEINIKSMRKHGAPFYYETFNIPYKHNGFYGGYLCSDREKADFHLMSYLNEQRDWFMQRIVTDFQFDRMKSIWLSSFVSSTAPLHANFLSVAGNLMRHGSKAQHFADYLQEIDAAKVQTFAYDELYGTKYADAHYGSIESINDLTNLEVVTTNNITQSLFLGLWKFKAGNRVPSIKQRTNFMQPLRDMI